jgi:hypothetical protein
MGIFQVAMFEVKNEDSLATINGFLSGENIQTVKSINVLEGKDGGFVVFVLYVSC